MPTLKHPYNYCESDDPAQTWATVTEYEMRMRKMAGLRGAFVKATDALQRLTIAIGGLNG